MYYDWFVTGYGYSVTEFSSYEDSPNFGAYSKTFTLCEVRSKQNLPCSDSYCNIDTRQLTEMRQTTLFIYQCIVVVKLISFLPTKTIF